MTIMDDQPPGIYEVDMIGMGCALENLALACPPRGLRPTIAVLPDGPAGDRVAHVDLTVAAPRTEFQRPQLAGRDLTREQWLGLAKPTLDRAAWLLARHARRFGIPLRKLSDAELRAGKRGVITHRQATRVFGGTHTDPGSGYPMDWVLKRATAYLKEADK